MWYLVEEKTPTTAWSKRHCNNLIGTTAHVQATVLDNGSMSNSQYLDNMVHTAWH